MNNCSNEITEIFCEPIFIDFTSAIFVLTAGHILFGTEVEAAEHFDLEIRMLHAQFP
jgi:hypothetical protein